MMSKSRLLTFFVALLCMFLGRAFHSIPRSNSRDYVSKVALNRLQNNSPTTLLDKKPSAPQDETSRKVAKYDNLGDPIYEDELASQGGSGLNILGIKIDADPLTVSLLVFALIAVQFFGVLFFQ